MDKEKIARINELANKAKEVGLTEEEKQEQKELRRLYVENVTSNLRAQLDNAYVQKPDGTTEKLEKREGSKE
ncbi:MAG: DUF896 domain-containing protein [Firmicutes bacterium]|nr:DUF896 domain-containing protein [Bacillota bacterium]